MPYSAKPGKRGLGHFTRGGLVLLCAAWERYVESALEEAAGFLTTRLPGIASLPPNAQQKTRDHANSNNTAWTSADLNTPTWKNIYLEVLQKRTANLNTPKHARIQPLFKDLLDIPDIAIAWSRGNTEIDAFVSLRGEVAHRGREGKYIWIGQLKEAQVLVTDYIVETDNYLSDHVRTLVSPRRRPWNRQ